LKNIISGEGGGYDDDESAIRSKLTLSIRLFWFFLLLLPIEFFKKERGVWC
jgi:hypothetical protein